MFQEFVSGCSSGILGDWGARCGQHQGAERGFRDGTIQEVVNDSDKSSLAGPLQPTTAVHISLRNGSSRNRE